MFCFCVQKLFKYLSASSDFLYYHITLEKFRLCKEIRCSEDLGSKLREVPAGTGSFRDQNAHPDTFAVAPLLLSDPPTHYPGSMMRTWEGFPSGQWGKWLQGPSPDGLFPFLGDRPGGL